MAGVDDDDNDEDIIAGDCGTERADAVPEGTVVSGV